MIVVAFVSDLMDRSRISAALPGTTFTADPAATIDADVVLVDLGRAGDRISDIRAATAARIVGFGPHVDHDADADARAAGADVVVARSRFFRDPAGVVADARA